MPNIVYALLFIVQISVAAYAPNSYISFIEGFSSPMSIAITPNGAYAYVGDQGSASVLVLDTQPTSPTFNTIIPAPALAGSFTTPTGIAITPDSRYAYIADYNSNSVFIVDTASNSFVSAPDLVGSFNVPSTIAITPNGQYAYVVNSGDNSISVIDLSSHSIINTPALNGILNSPFTITISPDGERAYVSNLPGSITVISTITNSPITTVDISSVNQQPEGLSITADGKFAYISNGSGASVTVLDLSSNTTVDTPYLLNAFNAPNGVATTADGNYAYVSNFLGAQGTISSVSLIDTNPSSPTYLSTLQTPGLTVPQPPPFTRFIALAATPNTQYVYVVDGFNNTVDVIYTGIIAPPTDVTVCATQNRFLLQIDHIYRITWAPPTLGISPTAYAIYRNTQLIATIPATAPLSYDDHNRTPGEQVSYSIASVDAAGNMSPMHSYSPNSSCT